MFFYSWVFCFFATILISYQITAFTTDRIHSHVHNTTTKFKHLELDISHFTPDINEHMFVSGFFDLGGFRDSRQSYIESILKVFATSKPMVFFCEKTVCSEIFEEAKTHNVYLIHFEYKESEMYQKYKIKTEKSLEHIKAIGRTDSDLIKLGDGVADYLILMQLKFELLQKAIQINPFNSTYMTWIDAGIFRHEGMIKNYDPKNIKCYKTDHVRFATGQRPYEPWSGYETTVLLTAPRREVAGTMMTFNRDYFVNVFLPRYWQYLDEVYGKNFTSTDQGIITLYVQRNSKEVHFVNSGYKDIAHNLMNINC